MIERRAKDAFVRLASQFPVVALLRTGCGGLTKKAEEFFISIRCKRIGRSKRRKHSGDEQIGKLLCMYTVIFL